MGLKSFLAWVMRINVWQKRIPRKMRYQDTKRGAKHWIPAATKDDRVPEQTNEAVRERQTVRQTDREREISPLSRAERGQNGKERYY